MPRHDDTVHRGLAGPYSEMTLVRAVTLAAEDRRHVSSQAGKASRPRLASGSHPMILPTASSKFAEMPSSAVRPCHSAR